MTALNLPFLDEPEEDHGGRVLLAEKHYSGAFRFFATKDGVNGVGVNITRGQVVQLAQTLLDYLEESE